MRYLMAVLILAAFAAVLGVRGAPNSQPELRAAKTVRLRPHPPIDPGERLPVRIGLKASPATALSTLPTASIGVLGPCVGISASVPVIRCAAAWAGIQYTRFLAVAERESSLIPTVTSRTGCCHGLFQLNEDYFAAWARRYTDLRWFGGIVPSYFDPRANALVAAGLWRSQGGPCPAWC